MVAGQLTPGLATIIGTKVNQQQTEDLGFVGFKGQALYDLSNSIRSRVAISRQVAECTIFFWKRRNLRCYSHLPLAFQGHQAILAPYCFPCLDFIDLAFGTRYFTFSTGSTTLYRIPSFLRMFSTSSVSSISVVTLRCRTSSLRLCFCFFNSRMIPRMLSTWLDCNTPLVTVLS